MASASNFIFAPNETFPEFLRLVTRGDAGTGVRSGKFPSNSFRLREIP
jgi:hypothetical protein